MNMMIKATIKDTLGSYSKVEQEAARWFLVMQQPDISNNEKRQFTHWLAADANNKSEYFRLRRIWQALPTALAQSTEAGSALTKTSVQSISKGESIDSLTSAHQQKKTSLLRLRHYATAACLCLVLFITQPWSESVTTVHYVNQVGKTKLITLNDGSTIKLNNDSKIIVAYSNKQRLINLVKGEAYFSVAKGVNRPFIVKHNNYQFKALGTEFLLRAAKSIKLIVTEHSVAVSDDNGRNIIVEQASGLEIGKGARKKSSWQALSKENIEQLLSWRKQQLIFNNQPLQEVLIELERYLQGNIHLSNASLANEPVTGIFNLDKPENILKLITEVLGLSLYQSKNKDYFVG
jgi:transmembrane sensor